MKIKSILTPLVLVVTFYLLAGTAQAQYTSSSVGSVITTTTTSAGGAPAPKPGTTLHIATSEANPDINTSQFWSTIGNVCARVHLESTEDWAGCDRPRFYSIGFRHYSAIDYLLPDSMKGDCFLYFLKDVDPISNFCGVLDLREVRGVGIGWFF